MTEPTTLKPSSVQAKAKDALGDRRTQVVLGVALVALGAGVWIGLKLKGPQEWVGSVETKPCADCAEKAKTVPAGAATRQLSPAELVQLADLMKPAAPAPVDDPVVFSPLAQAPPETIDAAATDGLDATV